MEREKRQVKLNEYLISMHIHCIIILLISLILSYKIPASIGHYTTYNIFIFLLVGFVTIFIISLYNKYCNINKNDGFTWINFAFIAIPTLISLLTVFIINDKVLYVETTLLLPVIISASIMGKNIGILMALVCSVLLIFHKTTIEHNSSIIKILYVV